MDFSNNLNDVKIPSIENPEAAPPLDKLKQPEDFGVNTAEKSESLGKLNCAEEWGRNTSPSSESDLESNEVSESGEVSVADSESNEMLESDKSSESEEVEQIRCLNQHLCGQKHPVTGVEFIEKIVKNEHGEAVKVVVPVFDSAFDAQLPNEKLQSTDREQFKECNKQLKDAVEKDPKLAKKFTPEQLEQIKNGDTPDGYTWHHHEDTGKMQLVDTVTHDKTAHTGGKAIWGGGRENR